MHRHLVFAALAVLVVGAASRLGVPEALGAHPFWAVKTGYLGALAGAVAGLALVRAGVRPVLVAGLLVAGAGLVAAKLGAARFAASYAEDALAGRFWFFGWIVVAAGAALVCQTALRAIVGTER